MGQGSQLVDNSQPASENVLSALQAARIAQTSPWAVGSLVAVTMLAPSATIRPSRAMTAPKGPPLREITFSVASAMARRKYSGLGSRCILLALRLPQRR